MKRDREKVIAAGINDYIAIPVDPDIPLAFGRESTSDIVTRELGVAMENSSLRVYRSQAEVWGHKKLTPMKNSQKKLSSNTISFLHQLLNHFNCPLP